MKKHLLFLIPFFTCVLLSQSLTAQQELKSAIASTAHDYESNDITKFKLDNSKKLKSTSISDVYTPISVDETAFDFKVSKAFGSYVIPNTNYLRIVSPNETNYTKAEFVNKKTGKQIFSFSLDLEKNVVDMSFTKAGIYTLILTNQKGDRHTEDIMVM